MNNYYNTIGIKERDISSDHCEYVSSCVERCPEIVRAVFAPLALGKIAERHVVTDEMSASASLRRSASRFHPSTRGGGGTIEGKQ